MLLFIILKDTVLTLTKAAYKINLCIYTYFSAYVAVVTTNAPD